MYFLFYTSPDFLGEIFRFPVDYRFSRLPAVVSIIEISNGRFLPTFLEELVLFHRVAKILNFRNTSLGAIRKTTKVIL